MNPPILSQAMLERCTRSLATLPSQPRGVPGAPDRRELEPLLASALVGSTSCEEYLAALADAYAGGTPPATPLSDFSLVAILQDGFSVLSEDELGKLARSPSAVKELNRRVEDALTSGAAGDYWVHAQLVPSEGIPAAYHEAGDRAVNEFRRIERETRPDDSLKNALPRVSERPRRWMKIAFPCALAASLLLAFYLGTQWDGRTGQGAVRLASVTARGDATRGIEDVALDVANGSDRRVFLTVVGLVPGRKMPAYHYRSEGRYIEAAPRETVEIKNLPPEFEGVTALLVFSTPTPAGGVIREVTQANTIPDSGGNDAERIRTALAKLGILADVKIIPLPKSKR